MSGSSKSSIKSLAINLEQIDQVYSNYATQIGHSYTELQIINLIFEIEDCTQKKICDASFLPKQTVNNVLKKLIDKNLVLLDNRTHKNKIILFTKSGRKYAEEILAPLRDSELIAMSLLSNEERNLLTCLLTKYTESFKKNIDMKLEEVNDY